jgi:hypothetical protein
LKQAAATAGKKKEDDSGVDYAFRIERGKNLIEGFDARVVVVEDEFGCEGRIEKI